MADQNAASRDSEQIKDLLIVREHARADALLRKDRRAFESLLAPGFVEINTLGRFTKEEFLDRLFPVLTLHEFTFEDPVLQVNGENTAVLSYRCYERLTVDKKPVVGTFRVTATYTRDGKQYRLVQWESRPVG
jgi:Domain of unknown function (DUF4440)